jgi:Zn-finger nucleic acid-binding protein
MVVGDGLRRGAAGRGDRRGYCPTCRLVFGLESVKDRCPQCGGVPHSLLRAELDGVIVPEWRRRRRP